MYKANLLFAGCIACLMLISYIDLPVTQADDLFKLSFIWALFGKGCLLLCGAALRVVFICQNEENILTSDGPAPALEGLVFLH